MLLWYDTNFNSIGTKIFCDLGFCIILGYAVIRMLGYKSGREYFYRGAVDRLLGNKIM